MHLSSYLDHFYTVFDYFEDEGYDTSSFITSHYTFNRTLLRKSDVGITRHTCPNKNIQSEFHHFFSKNNIGAPNCNDAEWCTVEYCEECGWWMVEHKSQTYVKYDAFGSKEEIYTGTRKTFRDIKSNSAITEVNQLLKRGHKQLNVISPRLLELALAEVFSSYYGTKVKHVGGPNDNGIDLFCVIGDETFLIQVKRRANGKAESVSVVRDLIGAYVIASESIRTSNHSAHIITSAPHFSKNANISAGCESLNKFNFSLGLHSYSELVEIFGFASGTIEKPWKNMKLKSHLSENEYSIQT